MRCDYQNLDNGDVRRYWSHGRVWVRRAGEWYRKRCGTLRIEWCSPPHSCAYGVTIGGGDAGCDLGAHLSVPWLVTAYVTLEDAFATCPFDRTVDKGHDRCFDFYFHNWALWYHIGVGSFASWSRDYPWCRWWRQGSIHFDDLLLGKQRHTLEILKENIPLQIPMPEGVYQATAKIERRTWKRPRWFAFSRVSVDVTIPKGIPFAGKGENSWDCGDDGLFGYGAEGTDLDNAIAHGVKSVLQSRRRHGMPSSGAIADALKS